MGESKQEMTHTHTYLLACLLAYVLTYSRDMESEERERKRERNYSSALLNFADMTSVSFYTEREIERTIIA